MRDLIQKYRELVCDADFLRFQHEMIAAVYDQLGQGCAEKEGEVALVTRIAETLSGQSYRRLRIHCEKIHGSKSYVSFNFRDKPTTKELGDLILISLITHGRKRLLQKLCIVQNKVLHSGKCQIDLEQLFLLKNFPLFSGRQGLFRHASDIMFFNSQECLGAYGFFEESGDLIHVNAKVLSIALGGGKTFAKTGLSNGSYDPSVPGAQLSGFSLPWIDRPGISEEAYFRRYWRGGLLPFGPAIEPLLSSRKTLHDLHDFLKAWTSLQIGEIVYVFDRAADLEAARFTDAVLQAVNYNEFIDFDDANPINEFDAGYTVMVSHLDLAQD